MLDLLRTAVQLLKVGGAVRSQTFRKKDGKHREWDMGRGVYLNKSGKEIIDELQRKKVDRRVLPGGKKKIGTGDKPISLARIKFNTFSVRVL